MTLLIMMIHFKDQITSNYIDYLWLALDCVLALLCSKNVGDAKFMVNGNGGELLVAN